MKNNCDMARDLMPLTIDGVASEASQQYVKEHLEECEACRAYLEGMKASLKVDAEQTARERQSFGQTAARMKLRRILRKLLLMAVIFVVAVAALYVGTMWHSAYYSQKIELTASEYSAQLSQLKDGRVIVTAKTYGKFIMDSFFTDFPDESGGRVGHVTLMSTRGSSGRQGEVRVLQLSSVNGYQVIEYGAGEPVTLWTQGKAIEPASPEMEAYYKAYDELEAFDREVEKRHVIEQAEKGASSESYQLTPEEAGCRYDLLEALRAAKDAVPEWGGRGRTPGIELPMG